MAKRSLSIYIYKYSKYKYRCRNDLYIEDLLHVATTATTTTSSDPYVCAPQKETSYLYNQEEFFNAKPSYR